MAEEIFLIMEKRFKIGEKFLFTKNVINKDMGESKWLVYSDDSDTNRVQGCKLEKVARARM